MSLPDRRILESMRRADLQKLCKERGLKANMKTEAIIDLLIDTDKPQAESSGAAYKRSSSMRIVSRPPSSSGSRNRVGSMIIHDTDNEEELEDGARRGLVDNDHSDNNPTTSQPSQIPIPAMGPATRTRRAGDDQRRLGLGRPKALGGAGLRAPPRAVSSTQIRKVKPSKSVRPVEVPIQEEEEGNDRLHLQGRSMASTHQGILSPPEQIPQAGPSGTSHDPPTNQSSPLTELSSQQPVEVAVRASPTSDDVVASLQVQLEQTQAEVQRLASNAARTDGLQSAVDELRAEVVALRSQTEQQSDFEVQLKAVREELAAMRMEMSAEFSRTRMPSAQSTVLGTISHELAATALPASSSSSAEFLTQSSLGKRHRTGEDIAGAVDEVAAANLAPEILETQVVRPTRKKARLVEREPSHERGHDYMHVGDEDDYEVMPLAQPAQRGPGFTVFSGREEPPEPLPNVPSSARLSDLFAASTPPGGTTPSLPTSTAHRAENRVPHTGNNAFTFSFANSVFQPVTSTPAAPPTMPAPEPPTSPTPALAVPGLVPLPGAPDTPAPPLRRTMYGTELELDTRFGDFGVEGVATMGFGWGAAPRY
ncbi:hypothetical protein PHLGIDRAFT_10039 [Phlebiopsis gigantea 11061_1 CR5-6]|uniref:Uncharacterized protein n=1 Tax=Phlebiopsis gigantea (strain 11061_1 CR5-6) TaxID=745531 RepID=A0A0C3S7S0_PHLG1|nr:hypothetical protein PHLGIDRAFT_10039 [Phlebiopsis gigantea 11061_1 CR5-6]